MNIATILLAAGSSERFGKDKLLLPFNNTTVLEHCISLFSPMTKVYLLTNHYQHSTVITISNNIGTRNDTIRAGLRTIPDAYDKIIIHDAARPFIDQTMITHIINESTNYAHIQYASKITDGLIRTTGKTAITVERNDHILLSTPLVMNLGLARYVYNNIIDNQSNVYDPIEFVSTHKIPYKLIYGSYDKLKKITYQDDYKP